jgi:hypothetical protein
MLLNFTLKCAIRKIRKNFIKLGLNRAYQLLVCADDIRLFNGNINTMKGNTCILLDATEKDGLEINAGRSNCK